MHINILSDAFPRQFVSLSNNLDVDTFKTDGSLIWRRAFPLVFLSEPCVFTNLQLFKGLKGLTEVKKGAVASSLISLERPTVSPNISSLTTFSEFSKKLGFGLLLLH